MYQICLALMPRGTTPDLPDTVQYGVRLVTLSSRSFELQKSAVGSVRPISRITSYNSMLKVSYTTSTDGNLNLYANGRQIVNSSAHTVYKCYS